MSGCFCGKEAVMAVGGRQLCKRHFIESVERRTRRTMREFRMLQKGDRLAAACSGGKDSVSLLYILKPVCDELGIPLTAIAIDEGICGYRDRALAVARKNCRRLNIPLRVFPFRKLVGLSMDDVMRSPEKVGAPCSYCGVFRRWALNRAAREIGATKLATGHNLDDAAQTVLMNMMRNEPHRLARFGPNGGLAEDGGFVRRIKPLIRIPERELALYAVLKGAGVLFQTCPYAGEAMRNEVRDFLNEIEERHPGTKVRILNSFLSIRPSLCATFATAEKPSRCSSCGEPASQNPCKRCEMVAELLGEKNR